jgi:hypothetical protein
VFAAVVNRTGSRAVLIVDTEVFNRTGPRTSVKDKVYSDSKPSRVDVPNTMVFHTTILADATKILFMDTKYQTLRKTHTTYIYN